MRSSSIKLRALVDSVFIYAFEFPTSNSRLIIGALNRNRFEAAITESTFKEVYQFFRKHYSKKLADQYRIYLFVACTILYSHQLREHFPRYAGLINERGLEQLAATRELGIKYLVSYDKHFQSFEEYKTPKEFAAILGLKTSSSDY